MSLIWIMDGHNAIFAIPALQRLQVSERREEARARLTDSLERFAVARGEKVIVVFDGNQMFSNPDAVRRPLFEVIFTRRGEGVADDRIIHEARVRHEQGAVVTVVTNDVATLARHLPRGVRHLGVEEFWLKHIDRRPSGKDDAEGGKPIHGDFSDLEREMLAQAALAEPASQARAPALRAPRTGGEGVAPPGSGARARAAGADARADRIALKRERGRLRQERRLRRRAGPARRR